MKPLLLELEGIGPYCEAQTVRFDRLEDLFVIAGDTGAGKTTLFDAVSFALYARPLGTRDTLHLRSAFLPPGQKARVRFRFACGGNTWEITRSLHVSIPGPTAKSQKPVVKIEATLVRLDADGRPELQATQNRKLTSEGVTEIVARDILKLSHAEFSKILVLPQGEFQQFLELESKERGAMLEKLFPVEQHVALVGRASTAVEEANARLAMLSAEREALLKSFRPDAYEATRADLEAQIHAHTLRLHEAEVRAAASRAAHQAAAALNAKVATLARACDDERQHRALQAGTDEKRRRLAEAQRAAPAEPSVRRREQSERELARRVAQLESTRAAMARQAEARAALEPQAQALPAREAALRATEQLVVELEVRERRLLTVQQLEAERAACERSAADCARQVAVATEAVMRSEGHLAALQAVQERRLALGAALEEAERRRAGLEALRGAAALVAAWDRDDGERRAVEDRLAQAEGEAARAVEAAEARRAELWARRDAAQAAALAQSLAPGSPCPVCGSTEHPRPAAPVSLGGEAAPSAAATTADVEAARRALDGVRERLATHRGQRDARRVHAEDERGRLQGAGFATPLDWREASEQAEAQARRLRDEGARLDTELARRPGLEAALAGARSTLKQREEAAHAGAQRAAAVAAQLAQARAELGPEPAGKGAHDVAAALVQVRALAAARRSALGPERAAIDALTQRWSELEKEGVRLEAALRSATAEVSGAEAACASARLAEASALAEAGFGELEALLRALLPPAEAAVLGREVERWATRMAELEALRGALEAEVAGRGAVELQPLEQAAAHDAAEHASILEARARLGKDLEALDAARGTYDDVQRRIATVEGGARGLIRLAKDLKGDNALMQAFPRWVLGYWFELVLERATERLSRLSEGRYSFVRSTDITHGGRQAGLDVHVFDAHATARRDAKTLSGGEKFLASLSLALGLADVIQERSGGIELDTLFIDEGFGALDPQAMDRALGVLDELGAHRQVGVISHVEGVKKAIPCHVLVERSPVGSRVVMPRRG